MKKVAVILSGCGVYDGSEINEVVLSLLALEQNSIAYTCFAPNINQHHVINHITGEEMADSRNVLIESARIVRGQVTDIKNLDPSHFDAIFIPGGFGAAKNLSDFTFNGASAKFNQQLLNAVLGFKNLNKPIAAICIAPIIVVKALGNGVNVTIGNDIEVAKHIQTMGGEHIPKGTTDLCYDEVNKVLTTPCYMLAKNILEVKSGIDNLVTKLKQII